MFCLVIYIVNDSSFQEVFDKFLTEVAFWSKQRRLQSQSLFCLGIERWILNQGVHKDPYMPFNLKGLELHIFIFFSNFFLDLVDYLISNVIDMSTSFGGADRVDKGNLFELSVGERDNHLPSVIVDVWISDFDCFLSVSKVHVDVLKERVYLKLLLIENYFDISHQSSHIVNPFSHKRNDIIIESIHSESWEFWVESNGSIIFSTVRFNLSLAVWRHVLSPNHPELLSVFTISALNDKFMRENIG